MTVWGPGHEQQPVDPWDWYSDRDDIRRRHNSHVEMQDQMKAELQDLKHAKNMMLENLKALNEQMQAAMLVQLKDIALRT